MHITIQIAGEKEVNRRIGVILSAGADLRPAFKVVMGQLSKFQKQVFDKEGSHAGLEPWQALAKSTIQRKGNSRILFENGKLMKGFTQDSSKGAVRDMDRISMLWGINESTIPYAKYHQSTKKRKAKFPRRAPLRLPTQMRREIFKIVQEHIFTKRQGVQDNL